MGVRLCGDAGKLFVGGRQVGNLYGWCFEGVDGDWKVTAQKYRLAEDVFGDVDLQFVRSGVVIRATGQYCALDSTDNEVHREPVEIHGSHVWITEAVPSGSR